MKRHTWLLAAVLALVMVVPSWAAPLFPDVPENHWARDAVASLAARGLVEGYPDGTFKGDRAATRWEVAMIVARFLARMEQEHATFATKAELDELRKLVNALREELDALGVRVTNLEENVARLDTRVTELERITFYGSVDTRFVAQTFRNTGAATNDNGIGQPGSLNYNALVGTFGGTQLSPLGNTFGTVFPFPFPAAGVPPASLAALGQLVGPAGVLPVMDFRNGRALTNGTGFSMRGVLGLRIRVSDDIDAGTEFSAYTSQGDAIVDATWGVTAPFLSNPYTGNAASGGIGGVQPLSNVPFTRMTLDNFWVLHNPSGTKLILGAFGTDMVDDIMFAGQYNPNAFGPTYLDRFGFDVSGSWTIEDTGVLRWEVLGTRLGDGNVSNATGTNYNNFALGMDIGFEFEGGDVKLNFLRAANEASGGAALANGLIDNVNVAYGAGFLGGLYTGWTPLQWVNPPGFYAAQLTPGQSSGLPGATTDNRPITGWNLGADNAVGGLFLGGGGFGPQGQDSYGISARYKWDFDDNQIYVEGEYAHSNYKPNRNSSYDVGGDAGRIEVGANILDGSLDLSLAYLTVDPTYDPFILQYPAASGGVFPGVWRLPDMSYFPNMYSLHDVDEYPHNREGIRFNGRYNFDDRHGLVWAFVEFLNQKQTSLYDIRQVPGSAGAGAPNFPVVGMSPGFIDPVFFGFAYPGIYGAGSASSFTDNLQPMENPRGTVTNWGLGYSYKFDNPRLKLDVGGERHEFFRPTSLPANFGGGQNYVNLQTTVGHFQLGWEADEKWTVKGGIDMSNIRGHWDPSGLYNRVARLNPRFDNINSTQLAPFVGFDYDVTANTLWTMNFTYYDTTDNIPAGLSAGVRTPPNPAPGFSAHPFNWQGWQVTSNFQVKF